MTRPYGIKFCALARTNRGAMPRGIRVHATVDGQRTLCGQRVPQLRETNNTHAVERLPVHAVGCTRCRDKLLANLWVEAGEGSAAVGATRIAEQLALHALDLQLLGVEISEHGYTAAPGPSGWPSLNSGDFRLAAIVHVADDADCAAVHAVLRARLHAVLAASARAGAVRLCVRHSTPDEDYVEAEWRLGGEHSEGPEAR